MLSAPNIIVFCPKKKLMALFSNRLKARNRIDLHFQGSNGALPNYLRHSELSRTDPKWSGRVPGLVPSSHETRFCNLSCSGVSIRRPATLSWNVSWIIWDIPNYLRQSFPTQFFHTWGGWELGSMTACQESVPRLLRPFLSGLWNPRNFWWFYYYLRQMLITPRREELCDFWLCKIEVKYI